MNEPKKGKPNLSISQIVKGCQPDIQYILKVGTLGIQSFSELGLDAMCRQ